MKTEQEKLEHAIAKAVALAEHQPILKGAKMGSNTLVSDVIYERLCIADNSDEPLEEYPEIIITALNKVGFAIVPLGIPHEILGEVASSGVLETGNPKHVWDLLIAKIRILPVPYGMEEG